MNNKSSKLIPDNKKEISLITLENLLKSKTIEVPKFQRFYSWEKSQIFGLINFLEKNESYMGQIISLKQSDKLNTISIVDGQQRLISLLLILIFAYSLVLIENKNIRQYSEKEWYAFISGWVGLKRVFGNVELISYKQEFMEEKPPRIKLQKYIKDLVNEIPKDSSQLKKINSHNDNYNNVDKENKNVINKQKKLHAKLKKIPNSKELYLFVDKLISKPKNLTKMMNKIINLKFAHIETDSLTTAYTVFHHLNTTSKPLDPSEKIRNYFYSVFSVKNDGEERDGFTKMIKNYENFIHRSDDNLTIFLYILTNEISSKNTIFDKLTKYVSINSVEKTYKKINKILITLNELEKKQNYTYFRIARDFTMINKNRQFKRLLYYLTFNNIEENKLIANQIINLTLKYNIASIEKYPANIIDNKIKSLSKEKEKNYEKYFIHEDLDQKFKEIRKNISSNKLNLYNELMPKKFIEWSGKTIIKTFYFLKDIEEIYTNNNFNIEHLFPINPKTKNENIKLYNLENKFNPENLFFVDSKFNSDVLGNKTITEKLKLILEEENTEKSLLLDRNLLNITDEKQIFIKRKKEIEEVFINRIKNI